MCGPMEGDFDGEDEERDWEVDVIVEGSAENYDDAGGLDVGAGDGTEVENEAGVFGDEEFGVDVRAFFIGLGCDVDDLDDEALGEAYIQLQGRVAHGHGDEILYGEMGDEDVGRLMNESVRHADLVSAFSRFILSLAGGYFALTFPSSEPRQHRKWRRRFRALGRH